MGEEISNFKEGTLRTDIFKKSDSFKKNNDFKKSDCGDAVAQSLLQKQIECAGIRHPNFHSSTSALNPDRPLTDIPAPSPRYQQPLSELLSVYGEGLTDTVNREDASMWALIASPELASHIELLQIGGLINLPDQFFKPFSNHSSQNQNRSVQDQSVQDRKSSQLLTPLIEMTLLDMSDIYKICLKHPTLTRYGFNKDEKKLQLSTNQRALHKQQQAKQQLDKQNLSSNNLRKVAVNMPEMINDIFAPSWEPILYPERFDNGVDSLTTDVLACSTAVHILKQCQSRQSLNRSLTAKQICQHMRSYVLSQCNLHPQFETQYRQIRLFEGHVVVAASYLGFRVVHANKHSTVSSVNDKGEASANLGQAIYLNVSSQSSLFTRYPNISSYYINGWS